MQWIKYQAKLVAKIEALKEIENGFRKELDDLKNAAKKAEKAKADSKRVEEWSVFADKYPDVDIFVA